MDKFGSGIPNPQHFCTDIIKFSGKMYRKVPIDQPAVSDRARSQGRRGVGSRRTSAGRRGGRWCREGRQHCCQVRHRSAAAAGCREQGCERHRSSPGCWQDLGWGRGWQAGYGNKTRVRKDSSHIRVGSVPYVEGTTGTYVTMRFLPLLGIIKSGQYRRQPAPLLPYERPVWECLVL